MRWLILLLLLGACDDVQRRYPIVRRCLSWRDVTEINDSNPNHIVTRNYRRCETWGEQYRQ